MQQQKLKIKIKKLSKESVLPQYAKSGDAGLDLTAISKKYIINGDYSEPDYSVHKDPIISYSYMEYGTGIAIEIPEGYVGLIFPRSSVSNTALILSNSVGVVDSGYRGEIKLRFKHTNLRSGFDYKIGDRIGQLIIMPYPQIEFEEVDELSSAERGDSGYGSTGK